MASTIKHVLLNTLEELTNRQRLKFRARLLDRDGEPRVRRSAVEDQDDTVVVDVLVSTFTGDAGRVVVDILKAIDCYDLAENLETSLPTLRRPRAKGTAQPTVRPEEHFVDRHRTALIQRLRMLAPILDRLLEHEVIGDEQYAVIMAQATPQAQVRQLYSGALVSSGTGGKDIFLSVLEQIEPFLIKDLRGN